MYYVFCKSRAVENWYTCSAILENGWIPFSHICSDPGFAPGDLWRRRPERQKAMEKLGITIDDTGELIDDSTIDESHPDLLKKNKEINHDEWNDKFQAALKSVEAGDTNA